MQAAISISTITICFIAYYFTIHSEKIHQYFVNLHGPEKAKSTWIMSQRIIGAFFFGLVPIAIVLLSNSKLEEIGLTMRSESPIWGWIAGPGLVCVLVNYFASQKSDHLEMYPQPWSLSLLFYSSATLVLYTLAYEIMFRGYLLFTCSKELGATLAIVINTSIYALVHIPKGWKETVGAIPMGVILCWLTLQSGNIWIAVFVHVALALSSEWFSIGHHRRRVHVA